MSRPAVTPIKLLNGTVKGQVATQSAAHRQDHAEAAPFAPLQHNNNVECFTTGKDYFKAVSAAMKKAKKSIFIAGWQVNWDLELTPDTTPGERLIDILHERVHSSESLRVYVMPWMSPKMGVNTFDLDTMLAIFQLNAGRKSMQAMCCPAGAQSDYVGTEGAAFSHHQKFVVIDNDIAFIGGIDLAYGRYDDATFSLDPGTRRFNERYNPGVGGTHQCTPADGAALSAIDLMSTTLSAGIWNAGGNTAPSALKNALSHAMEVARGTSLEAVALVNQAARRNLELQAAAVKAVARGSAHGVAVTADVAVAAGNAVSRQCARLSIPDLYGAVKAHNVGAAATSSLPDTLRRAETAARSDYNATIDNVAHLAQFLSPLTALRVSPTPASGLSQAAQSAERGGRAVINATVDVGAAFAGMTQQAAEDRRTACLEIGPALQSGVAGAKAVTHGAINQSTAIAAAAVDAVNAGINSLQLALIGEINKLRAAVNNQALAIIARGDDALDAGIQNLSQVKVQAILDHLMRLCKMFYVAQMALNWAHASAHPLLLEKGAGPRSTKAAASGGTMLGKTQPREPWQDVQAQIEGPAADDLAMNFIGRWNACNASYLSLATFDDLFHSFSAVSNPMIAAATAPAIRVVGA